MSTEAEVQQASDQFYAALNSIVTGDASPMAEIWSHESDVWAARGFTVHLPAERD